MTRWQAIESALLAAGAKEYERQELSRRAERRRMAGTPATHSVVRLKPDATYEERAGLKTRPTFSAQIYSPQMINVMNNSQNLKRKAQRRKPQSLEPI